MMDEQEQLISELNFSNIRFFKNGHTVLVMFESKGTMMGGRMYYNGSAVICFTFDDDGKILAFKIYTGTINKDWFKKRPVTNAGKTDCQPQDNGVK